jgi:hypothetical protein
MEGRLHIGNQESVRASGLILQIHNSEILGITIIILFKGCVLQLPGLRLGEQCEVPPVIKRLPLILGHFDLVHYIVLKSIESILGQALEHLDKSGLVHLVEPEVGDFPHYLSLSLGREDSLDS